MLNVTQEGEVVEEIKRPLIYEKISLIMDDMEVVAKNSKNAAQGWSFRSIEDIKNASNPAFRKHRVFYSPEVLEHAVEEKETAKGGKLTLHTVKVRYKLYTTDGSSVVSVVYGEAADSGDKGVGKAQTYAEKVMLVQVLNIPTKDLDPDEDSHEFAMTKPSQQKMEAESYRIRETPNEDPLPPAAVSSVSYDPSYRIDLGTQKSGEPHWLNGKSLEEAYAKVDSKTGSSELSRTYKYLKSHPYRNSKIRIFLEQAEAYLKLKDAEP